MSQLTNLLWRVALVSSITASACGGAQKASTVEVELIAYDGEIEEQSLRAAVLVFPWELQNPTAKKAGVGSVEWTFALDDEEPISGKAVIDKEAPAAGYAAGTIRVELVTSTKAEAFAARKDKVALKYTMTATFEVQSRYGDETIEAEWFGEIFPPRRPEVTIKAEAGRYGDRNYELSFEISIGNPNPFKIELGGLDYVLTVNDIEISKDLLARGKRVDPSSAIIFEIQRFIGRDDLPELANSLRGLDTIPYKLEGELKVGEIVIATPVTGEITFGR